MTSEIRYVVLPAAGYGVRMTGLTRGQPKELLNIRKKPAIFCPIWAAAEAGVEKAVIVIRKGNLFQNSGTARQQTELRSPLEISFEHIAALFSLFKRTVAGNAAVYFSQIRSQKL